MEVISAYLRFPVSELHVFPEMAHARWGIWLLCILLQHYRPSSSKSGLVSKPSTALEHVCSYYTMRLSLKQAGKGVVQKREGADLLHKRPEWWFANYQHSDEDTGADCCTGKWFAYISFRPTLPVHFSELALTIYWQLFIPHSTSTCTPTPCAAICITPAHRQCAGSYSVT